MHLGRRSMILIVLIGLSCGASDPSSPDDTATAYGTMGYPRRGVHHGSSFLSWGSEKIKEAARGDILIAPIDFCFSPYAPEIISEMKTLNPGIKIIGYQLVMGVPLIWSDSSMVADVTPYAMEFSENVIGDWAYTTTGDTLMLWPDLIFLNPIESDNINRELIQDIVSLIEKYQELSGNIIDGIMHDYFMDGPYLSPYVRRRVDGEIDLNGNGAIFADDPTEHDLLIYFQKEYAREIRRRLGGDFIQIANGLLHHVDGELAAILNGIFYEDFPQCRIGLSDRDGLMRLLDHHAEGYLTEARGRTWSIVTNETGGSNNLFCLVSSMLAGCLYTELHGKNLFTGWTLDIRGGEPLGETAREGKVDSILTFRRNFKYGEARASFYSSGRRSEVVFESNIGIGR